MFLYSTTKCALNTTDFTILWFNLGFYHFTVRLSLYFDIILISALFVTIAIYNILWYNIFNLKIAIAPKFRIDVYPQVFTVQKVDNLSNVPKVIHIDYLKHTTIYCAQSTSLLYIL